MYADNILISNSPVQLFRVMNVLDVGKRLQHHNSELLRHNLRDRHVPTVRTGTATSKLLLAFSFLGYVGVLFAIWSSTIVTVHFYIIWYDDQKG